MDKSSKQSVFNEKLLGILDKVEYRRISYTEDFEDIARLRRKAFLAADIMPFLGDSAVDDYDFDPQSYVFGVYYDEELVSTVRIHHVTPDHRVSPARNAFPEVLDPLLDAGKTIIDPARLAADPAIVREIPAIPYLTLRIATMATDYFKVDHCLAFVKTTHEAFYTRVFEAYRLLQPQYNWNNYNVDAVLLSVNVPATLPRLYTRFPFFRSQLFEQKMMFAPHEEQEIPPLTIRPTAKYLHAA
ncbi:MAG: hypothetical protein MnENMB40S_25990 [Rhizobiaceae bacterium MnEN-MB40S]|nr:MAG: hypothetical protein MnENMB40S_25990 [Rhizobiaceae bacterium MnEN-MB40S]